MTSDSPPLFSPSLQNLAYGLIVVTLLVFFLKVLSPLLQPLFVAVFVYYISQPLARWLNKRGIPLVISQGITLLLIAGIVIGFGWSMSEQLDDFAQKLPALQAKFRSGLQILFDNLGEDLPFLRRKMRFLVRQVDFLGAIDSQFPTSFTGFIRFMSASALMIFYLIFIYHERNTLPSRLVTIYGRERARSIQEVGTRISESIVQYLYVKFLASLITAVLAIVIMLAFRLELVFLWGSILFFANFVPYVGSILAFTLPIGYGFLQFENPLIPLIMATLFIIVDMIVGNYWEPRYAGYRLNISPLVILLSLAFWGWLWGFVGMVLCVPIMVSIKFFLENIKITRNIAVLMSNE